MVLAVTTWRSLRKAAPTFLSFGSAGSVRRMASQAGRKSGKRKEAQARRETQAAAEVRRSAALGRAAAEGLGGERCRRETRAAAGVRIRPSAPSA